MISRKSKYAIRAMLYLAGRNRTKSISVEEIAATEKISRKFLESILLTLRKEGIVESKRGKGGGYLLRNAPDELTIGRIIRAVDGPLSPVSCVSRSSYRPCSDCLDEESCRIRWVMEEVREAISKVLDSKTLGGLLREERETQAMNWMMAGI